MNAIRAYTDVDRMLIDACYHEKEDDVRRIFTNYYMKLSALCVVDLISYLIRYESDIANILNDGNMKYIYLGFTANNDSEDDEEIRTAENYDLYLRGIGYSMSKEALSSIDSLHLDEKSRMVLVQSAIETCDSNWILYLSRNISLPLSADLISLCPYEVHEAYNFPCCFYTVARNGDLRVVKKYYENEKNINDYELGRLWGAPDAVYDYFTSILDLPNEGQSSAVEVLSFSQIMKRNLFEFVSAWRLDKHIRHPEMFAYVLENSPCEDIEYFHFSEGDVVLLDYLDQAQHLGKYFAERSSIDFLCNFVEMLILSANILFESRQEFLKIVFSKCSHRIPKEMAIKFIVYLFEGNPCRECLIEFPTFSEMYDVEIVNNSPSPKSSKDEEECIISGLPIRDSYVKVNCCQMKFNENSIFRWLKMNRTCPHCRREIFIGPNQRRWKVNKEKALDEVEALIDQIDKRVCNDHQEWKVACALLYDLLSNGDDLPSEITKTLQIQFYPADQGRSFRQMLQILFATKNSQGLKDIFDMYSYAKKDLLDAIVYHAMTMDDNIAYLRDGLMHFIQKEYGELPENTRSKLENFTLPRVLYSRPSLLLHIYLNLNNEEADTSSDNDDQEEEDS